MTRRVRSIPAGISAVFAIAVGVGLASCTWISPKSSSGTNASRDRRVLKPLNFQTEAKSPAHALILGTDQQGGSTSVPLAGVERQVGIEIMWVRIGTGPAVGGASPVAIATAPNPDGQIRVGVYEGQAGGLGAQWRAGVWLAAFVSSSALNKDLTDFKFTAESGGLIDGASASGLMTAGFLASMLGLPIANDVTMTGIINPDGTIGPVGGIPQKFLASIERGKKRLGYPIGMRFAADINTGELIDLVQLAKDHGAEAIEVADAYGALELITGTKLPRPTPVAERDMALDDDVMAALANKYVDWQTMVANEWAKLVELDQAGKLPKALVDLALTAENEATAAEKLRSQGLAASAYPRIVRAWVYAAASTATWDILDLAQAGDLDGANAKLTEFEALSANTEAALLAVAERTPDTMGSHLQMLSGFQNAISGWGFQTFANDFLVGVTRAKLAELAAAPKATLRSAELADEIVLATAPTTRAIANAVAWAVMSREAMDIEGMKSINYMCSLPNVRRMSTSFQSAAGANLAYFDALIVADVAKELGVPQDQAKVQFAGFEPDYLVGQMAGSVGNLGGLPEKLKTQWGESTISWGLFSLAASQLSFFRTSLLLSKWYSLGVKNDPATGLLTSVEHEKAFTNMLAFAEVRARENAHAAKVATGEIPVQARLRYQAAKVLSNGDLTEKLQALEAFWSSSAFSQTAVMLARN